MSDELARPTSGRKTHANAAAAVEESGPIAHPPMEAPGHGTFAIHVLGGIEHGPWGKGAP